MLKRFLNWVDKHVGLIAFIVVFLCCAFIFVLYAIAQAQLWQLDVVQ